MRRPIRPSTRSATAFPTREMCASRRLGTFPEFPYEFGRFSNGLNWLDDLTAKVLGPAAAPATPSLAGGNDFAWGGAQTGTTIVSGDPIVPTPREARSVSSFKSQVPSPAPGRALHARHRRERHSQRESPRLKSGAISFDDMTTTFLNAAVSNTVDAVKDSVRRRHAQPALLRSAGPLRSSRTIKTSGHVRRRRRRACRRTSTPLFSADVKALDLSGLTVFDLPQAWRPDDPRCDLRLRYALTGAGRRAPDDTAPVHFHARQH